MPDIARNLGVSLQGRPADGGSRDTESALMHAEHSTGEPAEDNTMKEILDLPWADRPSWLLDLLLITIVSCFMGAASYPYGLVTDKVHEWWLEKTGPEHLWENPESFSFKGGSTDWIWITCLCCTAVGVLKVGLNLDKYPSFIAEMKKMHVDPLVSMKVLVSCIASLCAGATLGLEAGLGALGGAVGLVSAEALHWILPVLARSEEDAELRRRTYILCGIAAGFGAILPSPFIAVLLVAECSSAGTEQHSPQGEFMAGRSLPKKVIFHLVPAVTFSFVARYILTPTQLTAQMGALEPYDNWSPVYAVLLGAIAALVGFAFLVAQILTKLIVGGLGAVIERKLGKPARQIILASIGGVVTGCGIFLYPLAYSSGRSAMLTTIKFRKNISTEVLIGTAITKTITYWVGTHCGLVGGMFFPLMYVGLIAGEVSARWLDLDDLVAVPLMVGAVPASFITAPLTMLALPVGMFVMGPLNTIPIFVGIATSNTILVGTGFLRNLMLRGRR